MKKYLKEISLLIVIVTIFSNILSYYRSMDINSTYPNLDSLTLIDDKGFKYNKNSVLVVYFWGSWCPICKIASPNIQILSKYYDVLSVAVKSGSTDDIHNYLSKNELSLNTFNDVDGNFTSMMNIKTFPTIMVYSSDGKLVYRDVGYTSTFMLIIKAFLASF